MIQTALDVAARLGAGGRRIGVVAIGRAFSAHLAVGGVRLIA
ncbi:MAG: hypothetical protein ACXWVS_12210 [Hyphomicrobium sp.]|nr:hypothetical protein [Casimicrobiaceae bacterium]